MRRVLFAGRAVTVYPVTVLVACPGAGC